MLYHCQRIFVHRKKPADDHTHYLESYVVHKHCNFCTEKITSFVIIVSNFGLKI